MVLFDRHRLTLSFYCVPGMSVRGSRAGQPTAIPLSLLFIIALSAMRPVL